MNGRNFDKDAATLATGMWDRVVSVINNTVCTGSCTWTLSVYQPFTTRIMAIELLPLPLSASADASTLAEFGREVKGINPAEVSPEEFKEIEHALYKVSLDCFSSIFSGSYLGEARSFAIQRCTCISRSTVCVDEGQHSG